MAHWIKIIDERNEHIVNFDQISAFACAPNGKITFWLPDSAEPLIVNRQRNPDGYQQVLDYMQNLTAHSLVGYWLRVNYDRNEYVIDLNRLSAFSHSPAGRITLWLPDSHIAIIINKQSDPDTYQKVLDYIQDKTGCSFT